MNYKISPDDPILQEDIEKIAGQIDFSPFYGSSVLITGATGFLGSQIIKTFIFINKIKNAQISIYGLIKNYQKAKIIFNNFISEINIIEGDITKRPILSNSIDFIVHGASITSSQSFIKNPVETIDTALIGTRNMLQLAKEKKVKGFVYLSSMEVFGITEPYPKAISESDYGYIDILNPRSSYSESKRMCECLCACFSNEYHVPVKIARLTQTLGSGMDYTDSRVTAQFARSIIENKDIILKTNGKTFRPCLYSSDAITGILTVLIKGKQGEAYTLANKTTAITIFEIAEMVAKKIGNNSIKVVFDIDNPIEFSPDLNLYLNTDKVEALGWKAEIDIEESYRRMIASMRARLKNTKV